ncbi:D-alanyl-D-alanine carboxypeptidase family protein [Paludifilum halophilum]|uniref:serine-type D-Ala-D-Ala carboxypeptidase n=1 Tax=Paludifilum halophilum TaxID=1642702 RepID=A0A235BCS6_9BACL|nr:D-alanyl-D-alanine carboxypeptidase family protein [Paludifilum halophilum]OYD09777.1 D-alanyl-D-alanine carboxypeptidase [Paludifilum halophilum]
MRFRICMCMLSFCLLFSFLVPVKSLAAEESGLAPKARSAILIDSDTGTVLYEKNSREKLPPASITKIMTMLLIMEALEQGKISYDDTVRVSDRAESMGGSQIFLESGETMRLRDLLKGVAVGSANDASVALAEHIAGTEEAFVERMNERAKELGMNRTHFQNTSGLSAPDHYTTAEDIAVMSRELLKHPEITRYTRIYEDYLRKDTENPFWLVNTNRLVRFYKGMDGIKTGFTSEAKYCLSATAQKGTFRAIAIVMGEPDPKARNGEISRMLDYAFNQYTNHVVYKKGDWIDWVPVDKGLKNFIQVRSPQRFSLLVKKGENASDYTRRVEWKRLSAPVKKGQTIGHVVVENKGKVLSRMELVSARDIPRADAWTLMKRTTKKMFFLPEQAPTAKQPSTP